MAATENNNKIACRILLNNGSTSTGATKTVAVGLPTVNKNTYTADKFANIGVALSPIFTKSVFQFEAVKYFSVFADI